MLTLTDRQYHALPKVAAHYWPDGGDKVEIEQTSPKGTLTVRVFNGRLRPPREIQITPEGRVR